MTPLDACVVFGPAPAIRPVPPIASIAINAPTAPAPFRTLRRVPLLPITAPVPPSSAAARDQNALYQQPYRHQAAECDHEWADSTEQGRLGRGHRLGDGRRGRRSCSRRSLPSRRRGGRGRAGRRLMIASRAGWSIRETGCQLRLARDGLQRLLATGVECDHVDTEVPIARRSEQQPLAICAELERTLDAGIL